MESYSCRRGESSVRRGDGDLTYPKGKNSTLDVCVEISSAASAWSRDSRVRNTCWQTGKIVTLRYERTSTKRNPSGESVLESSSSSSMRRARLVAVESGDDLAADYRRESAERQKARPIHARGETRKQKVGQSFREREGTEGINTTRWILRRVIGCRVREGEQA